MLNANEKELLARVRSDAGWPLVESYARTRRELPQEFEQGASMLAQRLHELGLVTRVSPPGQALTRALELADGLNSRAPNTLASIKELVNGAPHATLGEQLQRERDHFVRNLHHANGGEGIQAFLDKRAARYR